MKLPANVTHEFVELIPTEREEGKIYISIAYSTAVHSCLCGCGMKVVTPIKPNKWTLTYNGDSISLSPSVGNWSFTCRSHYWIRENMVLDAGLLSETSIEDGRTRDARLTEYYYTGVSRSAGSKPIIPEQPVRKRSFWDKLFGR